MDIPINAGRITHEVLLHASIHPGLLPETSSENLEFAKILHKLHLHELEMYEELDDDADFDSLDLAPGIREELGDDNDGSDTVSPEFPHLEAFRCMFGIKTFMKVFCYFWVL